MERYKMEELIGEGSFGSVYLVRNEQAEKFAYKRVRVDPFQAEEAQLQIDIMKKFAHPNLVQVYQHHFQQEKQELHIIMEYCQGGDLAHYIKNNKNLQPPQILNLLKQLVHAFIAMSAQGVIHRDLKPENILLTKDLTLKIADFGCAKCVGINNISLVDSRSMEKGTYLYASPQQLKMEKYSFKCDVWAAGCVAFQLQYGYHPFLESSPHNVLASINKLTHDQPIPLQPATDPTIATFIALTLINQDTERASWRELQLARIFAPKIKNIDSYIQHLKVLSPIANHIVKQFWKVRKHFTFPTYLDQIFIYYLIKFQMDNLKMCLKILKKSEMYNYLFDPTAFEKYQPKEETFNQVKKSYLEYEKYFTSIKKSLEAKQCYVKYISQYESKRVSAFIDLDKSVRTAYKILKTLKKELAESVCKDNKVWVLMARWTNFEQWFAFEKNPELEFMNAQPLGDVMQQIQRELQKYERGSPQ